MGVDLWESEETDFFVLFGSFFDIFGSFFRLFIVARDRTAAEDAAEYHDEAVEAAENKKWKISIFNPFFN